MARNSLSRRRFIRGGLMAGAGALAATAGSQAFADVSAARRSAAVSYDDLVLSHNPVSYWRMAHPSHGHEVDETGNGHTGYYHNVTSTVSLPNGHGGAVFNGSNGYFSVATDEAFSISTTGRLSVEAWIRPHTLEFPNDEQSGYVHFMGKGLASGPNGDREWGCRMYSKTNDENRPNRISGYAWNLEGGYGAGAYFQEPVSVNEFIHYVVTYNLDDGPHGTVRIYRNGVFAHSDGLVYRPGQPDEVIVRPEPGNAPVRVGTREGQSWFQGMIAKVAIYGHALTEEMVGSHYDAMYM